MTLLCINSHPSNITLSAMQHGRIFLLDMVYLGKVDPVRSIQYVDLIEVDHSTQNVVFFISMPTTLKKSLIKGSFFVPFS